LRCFSPVRLLIRMRQDLQVGDALDEKRGSSWRPSDVSKHEPRTALRLGFGVKLGSDPPDGATPGAWSEAHQDLTIASDRARDGTAWCEPTDDWTPWKRTAKYEPVPAGTP